MRSFAFVLVLFAVLGLSSTASARDVVDPGPFDALLKKYVDANGGVAYAKWKGDEKDRAALDAYVASIGAAKVKGSDAAKLAFYINAYNALTLKSIIDLYPIESVMKVDGFFKKKKHRVAGRDVTLDELEHQIIRKQFSEPRIHFVLVCGAKSCPPLRRQAATEKNLETLLESSTKRFVPRATKLRKDGSVTTSKLFEWFAEDFVKKDGSVAKFLARYVPEHEKVLLGDGARIRFSEYSWKLNEQ